jgi:hypothetical protein
MSSVATASWYVRPGGWPGNITIEKHDTLEVPKEFEGTSLEYLAKSLRVNVGGEHSRLEPKAPGD